MEHSLALVVVGIHFALLGILSIFGMHRIHLVGLRLRHQHRLEPAPVDPCEKWPLVTIQVPLYNEQFVAERIIDAVAAFDYPGECLEIQILDDSTDETVSIVAERVALYRAKGISIEHVRRPHRQGYKAGALTEGLKTARGEFVAIFDADFIPSPELLKAAIPHLTDPNVAVAQVRWGHLNRDVSYLTEIQAIRLDAHFAIEQTSRAAAGLHFNFNGTAGIWRVAAIQDAGGWQNDTLTEDLDLSYRAQLRGWDFKYLPNLDCPSELPTELIALETQQHRWAKGATQVLMKLFRPIWESNASPSQKIEATFHLSGNLAYLVMVIDSVFFLVPSLVAREVLEWRQTLWIDVFMLLFSSGGHLCFFIAGQLFSGYSLARTFRFVPILLSTGVGLAINDARAVTEALLGRESEFVRTPKRGDRIEDAGPPAKSRPPETTAPNPPLDHRETPLADPETPLADPETPLEGVLRRPELLVGIMYGIVTIWAVVTGLWVAVPFLLLLHVGFLSNGIRGLREQRRARLEAST